MKFISEDVSIQLLLGSLLISNALAAKQAKKKTNYSYCDPGMPSKSSYKPLDGGKLLSVFLMNRHGDRAPLVYLPNGMEKGAWNCGPGMSFIKTDYNTWATKTDKGGCETVGNCKSKPITKDMWQGTCAKGQLTPKGVNQLKKLGGELRKIYVDQLHFLNHQFDDTEIDVASTNVWRTQQSGVALVKGLYPNSKSPVRIFTQPKGVGTIVPSPRTCPKLRTLQSRIFSEKQYMNYKNEAKAIRKSFSEVIGNPGQGSDNDDLTYYADVFQARKCNNFPQVCKNNKKCITKVLVEKSLNVANKGLKLQYRDTGSSHPTLSRLRVGGFLLSLKNNFLNKVKTYSKYKDNGLKKSIFPFKFTVLSAHDTSISALLGALLANDMRWPSYASNVIFELWYTKKPSSCCQGKSIYKQFRNYQIRMIYNGAPLKTSWCPNGQCNVSKLISYLDNDLKLFGGFERYGKFTDKSPPIAWDGQKECNSK